MGLDDDENAETESFEGCYTLDSKTLRCNEEGLNRLVEKMP